MTARQPSSVPWRAMPLFAVAWLYVPMLVLAVRLIPRGLNENVLALAVQIPALMAVAAVGLAVRLRWAPWGQVVAWALGPNVIVCLGLSLMSD